MVISKVRRIAAGTPVRFRNRSGVAASSSLIVYHENRSKRSVALLGPRRSSSRSVTDSRPTIFFAPRPSWHSKDFFPCRTAPQLDDTKPSHRPRRRARESSLGIARAAAAAYRHCPISISVKLGLYHWTAL